MKNNMSRRQFLKTGGLALAAMTFQPASVLSSSGTFSQRYVSLRPSASKRNFISKAVDAAIEEAKPKIKDETILSRELSLEDIKKTVKKSPIETEVFIHGAMCMAISGRCFLSSGLYGRSANCGDCLQPCRKNWTLTFEEDNNDSVINLSEVNEESFVISKSYDGSYRTNFFSPRDMMMIEHVPELIKAGIDSFKIEGRARSPDYGAMVTNVYRQAIDKYYENPTGRN